MVAKLDTAPRVGQQVYDAIYSAIMSGEYPAGKRLQIRDLARDLGTSVMPVREALGRLEAVGLVENKPYRGAEVRALGRAELLDIYSVRRLLEVQAARLGVQGLAADENSEAVAGNHADGALAPPAGVAAAALEEGLKRMRAAVEAGDSAAYLDADEEFLATIYRAADSPVLLEYIQSLWNRSRHYKLIGVAQRLARGHAEELFGFQTRLLEAVRKRDPEAAARVSEESVDEAIARIESGLYERSAKD